MHHMQICYIYMLVDTLIYKRCIVHNSTTGTWHHNVQSGIQSEWCCHLVVWDGMGWLNRYCLAFQEEGHRFHPQQSQANDLQN